MEKLNKVIAGLECCLSDADCDKCCPYFKGEYRMDGCMDEMMAEAVEVLKECRGLEKKLELAKNGRLNLARHYRKTVGSQTETIIELNRDLERCRKALNAQGEYAYLGGDLISRRMIRKAVEVISWYGTNDKGVLHTGAANEESAYVRYADVARAVEAAMVVEAEPVVHAHWEDEYGGKYANPRYRCSACKAKSLWKPVQDELLSWHEVQALTERCPHCGAHMDEEVADV